MKILNLFSVSFHSICDMEDKKIEFFFETEREQKLFFEKLRRGCLNFLEKKSYHTFFKITESSSTFEIVNKNFWTSSDKKIIELEKNLRKKLKIEDKLQFEGAIRISKTVQKIKISQIFDFK